MCAELKRKENKTEKSWQKTEARIKFAAKTKLKIKLTLSPEMYNGAVCDVMILVMLWPPLRLQ